MSGHTKRPPIAAQATDIQSVFRDLATVRITKHIDRRLVQLARSFQALPPEIRDALAGLIAWKIAETQHRSANG